ncbi:MAG: penicillin-binding protein [Bacteroidales bacterium]|nr:penicillin-binding protein [Bacteroidales bacterium]
MEDLKKDILWRLWLLYWALFAISIVILGKAIFIQTVKGESYKKLSEETTVKYGSIEAMRGNVLAADGSLLATTVPIFDVRMDVASSNISSSDFKENIDSLAFCLSKLFRDKPSADYKAILQKARKSGERYLLLKRNVDYTAIKKLEKFPIFRRGQHKGGLILIQKYVRRMPYGLLARRTIGYENETENLFVGLEGAYNKYLQGVTGKMWLQRISGGEWIPLNNNDRIEPQNGKDVVSTIDIRLQDVAESALMTHLIHHKAEQGCAVLMKVSTGEIMAIANLKKNKEGRYDEIYNYALAESIEPGSTFKLASMISVLEEENTSLEDSVSYGNGSVKWAGHEMKDSHPLNLKYITFREAFEESSNVGVSKFVSRCFHSKPERYTKRLYDMSLGKKLGLEIQGENAPFIKHPDHKEWSATSLPWMSIGYELRITPIQTLTFYNAIANNGVMVKPHFVKEIRESGKSALSIEPEIINPAICSQNTLLKAKEMLEGVIKNGTGKNVFKNSPYSVAGKTGTAQIARGGSYNKSDYNASFVGYFPADNPEFSCIVVVNNPTEGEIYGGRVAAPVFREIADKVYATHISLKDKKQTAGLVNNEILMQRWPDMAPSSMMDLALVCASLSLPIESTDTKSNWVKPGRGKGGIILNPLLLGKKFIPDVSGMTARDAIFILEDIGLKVKFSGKGRVSSQSLKAGSPFNIGSEIFLQLSSTSS